MTSDGDQRLFDRRFNEIVSDFDDDLASSRALVIWIPVSVVFWAAFWIVTGAIIAAVST
jgi:hypothetical protein